jgi:hypothetical protein
MLVPNDIAVDEVDHFLSNVLGVVSNSLDMTRGTEAV